LDERKLEISILLTTYNRTADCIKCLNKLLDQKTESIEIILLDDYHIVDPVLQIYCENHSVKYVHTGQQKNGRVHWRVPGFAYNIGAKLAKGGYFIIGCAEIEHIQKNSIQKLYKRNSVTYPRIWDQPKNFKGKYTTWNRLNGKFPFCMGVPSDIYFNIGGYDEDFTGYCFDDADFSDRLQLLLDFEEVDIDVVHLWNARGAKNRGDRRLNDGKAWYFNKRLYEERRGKIIRNENKTWGIL
jgi:glycosyltransferase involved in cell wall biosynthesis